MESIGRGVVFLPFWVMSPSSSKRPVLDPILGFEVARYILVVRGVVQVVQNWFTGIPNPTRSLRLE